jgi:hypothetical protein
LIPGGYGTFGKLLAREILTSLPVEVVIAGRNAREAAKVCRELGAAEFLVLDLNDLNAVRRATAGCFAMICAAGPFQTLNLGLPAVVAAQGCHWLDISDFSGWVLPLVADRSLQEIALKSATVIMPGLSTVPALSGVLVRWLRQRVPGARQVRVTLFIGNRNPKGAGAISSFLLSSIRDDDPVPVSLPIGRRFAYRFHSPDEVLLARDFGLEGEFRVAFEWRITDQAVALARLLTARIGALGETRVARWLSLLAAPFGLFGSDMGCLKAELLPPSGNGPFCAFIVRGQRLAIVPCVIALESLRTGELQQRGVLNSSAWLEPEEWIERLRQRKIEFIADQDRGQL